MKRADLPGHGGKRLNHDGDERDAAMHCHSSESKLPLEHRHGGTQIDRESAKPLRQGDASATSGSLLHVFERDRVNVKEDDPACEPWNVVNDKHSIPSVEDESESSEGEAEVEGPKGGVTGLA